MKYVISILALSLPLVLTGCGSDSAGAGSPSLGGVCTDAALTSQQACTDAGGDWCDHACAEAGVRICDGNVAQNCVAFGEGCRTLQFADTCIAPEECQEGYCGIPGSGDGADATGGGDDDTTGGGGGGSGTGLACELIPPHEGEPLGANCDDPSCPCGVTINTVTGVIQDASGAPIAGAKAQVCSRSARDGSTVCLAPVDTTADGSFTLAVPANNNCMYESVMRALVPNQAYSTAYCTISGDDLAAPGGTLDLSVNPTVLYPTIPATDAPDYVPDENGDDDTYATYTVVFGDDMEIDVVPGWYFNGAVGHKPMAATYIPGTDHLCNAAAIEGAAGVWAISPEGDIFKTTFAARIRDNTGLADGTVVNLFIQGGIGHTTWEGEEKTECEEGTWTHFACATVENGWIDLAGDHGLPSIGWLAYVPAE